MKEKEPVFIVDNRLINFSVLSSLNIYENKKALFIRRNGITYQSFEILLRLYNSWVYTGKGLTVHGLNVYYDGYHYTSIHNRLTTLFRHGFVERYVSNNLNYFMPTSKGIDGITSLMSEQ